MIRTTYLENLTKNLVFTITTTKELGKLKTTTISQMKKFYFTLQSNSTKYKKPFKCISLPNFFERNHILIPEIWSKTFSD